MYVFFTPSPHQQQCAARVGLVATVVDFPAKDARAAVEVNGGILRRVHLRAGVDGEGARPEAVVAEREVRENIFRRREYCENYKYEEFFMSVSLIIWEHLFRISPIWELNHVFMFGIHQRVI